MSATGAPGGTLEPATPRGQRRRGRHPGGRPPWNCARSFARSDAAGPGGPCWTGSPGAWTRGGCMPWPARRGRARRRCCGSSPAWTTPTAAPSSSTRTTWRPMTRSRWPRCGDGGSATWPRSRRRSASSAPRRTSCSRCAHAGGARARPAPGRPACWLASGCANAPRQRAGRLSAGEAQRLALARALASARGLLIVDEPTSRLDEANATMAAELLSAAAREDGQTVLCATHDERLLAARRQRRGPRHDRREVSTAGPAVGDQHGAQELGSTNRRLGFARGSAPDDAPRNMSASRPGRISAVPAKVTRPR